MTIKENPFYILGASPRDSKQVLHEKADDKTFEFPEEECRNAERILLNPKRRIEAEISWFPGLSPKKIREIIAQVEEDKENKAFFLDFYNNYYGVCRANAIALFLSENKYNDWQQDKVETIIRAMCSAANSIDASKVLSQINDDRTSSGFPMINGIEEIQEYLDTQQIFYKKVLHSFLNNIDSTLKVRSLTCVIEDNTNLGKNACPWPLLDYLISDYEVEAIPFFEKQESMIDQDISHIRGLLSSPDKEYFFTAMHELETDVMTWDLIAQPIQVLQRSKGIEHKRSKELSEKLRALALDAHNKYGQTDISVQITQLQQNVFAELRHVSETAADDSKQLKDILAQKRGNEIIQNIISKAPEFWKDFNKSVNQCIVVLLKCLSLPEDPNTSPLNAFPLYGDAPFKQLDIVMKKVNEFYAKKNGILSRTGNLVSPDDERKWQEDTRLFLTLIREIGIPRLPDDLPGTTRLSFTMIGGMVLKVANSRAIALVQGKDGKDSYWYKSDISYDNLRKTSSGDYTIKKVNDSNTFEEPKDSKDFELYCKFLEANPNLVSTCKSLSSGFSHIFGVEPQKLCGIYKVYCFRRFCDSPLTDDALSESLIKIMSQDFPAYISLFILSTKQRSYSHNSINNSPSPSSTTSSRKKENEGGGGGCLIVGIILLGSGIAGFHKAKDLGFATLVFILGILAIIIGVYLIIDDKKRKKK